MKRHLPVLLLLTILAGVCGYLLSKINVFGRAGIALLYKEYSFLRVWWEAGGVVLCVWIVLFTLHVALQRSMSRGAARTAHITGLLAAVGGLYLTYRDFRTDISHRILGSPFHTGAYLFWLGWILIAIYMLSRPNRMVSQVQVERR